ncbi:unnamed protein product [Rhodiola kirilowii]
MLHFLARQTALFFATQDKKVVELAHLSFNTDPIYVDVDEGRSKVTNEGLKQGYCIVPSEKRFIFLLSFLKKNKSKKVMVFFSSCGSVKVCRWWIASLVEFCRAYEQHT